MVLLNANYTTKTSFIRHKQKLKTFKTAIFCYFVSGSLLLIYFAADMTVAVTAETVVPKHWPVLAAHRGALSLNV